MPPMLITLPQDGILPLFQFQPYCEGHLWLQLKIGLFSLLYVTSYI